MSGKTYWWSGLGFCSVPTSSSTRKYYAQENGRDVLSRPRNSNRDKADQDARQSVEKQKLDEDAISTLRTSRASRPHRPHRCSRCGGEGHNVRACPMPSQWFHQRCGRCGMQGHNARNCPIEKSQHGSSSSATCRVCSGAGRLPCSKCNGPEKQNSTNILPAHRRAVYARRARAALNTDPNESRLVFSPPLSKAQRRMADDVRSRVRNYHNNKTNSNNNNNRSNRLDNDDNLSGHTAGKADRASDEGTELIGKGMPRPPLTAPVITAASRSTTSSLSGYIFPSHSSRSAYSGTADGAEQPCSRCMGTGYLTCMACS